jgi:hypothetical protein
LIGGALRRSQFFGAYEDCKQRSNVGGQPGKTPAGSNQTSGNQSEQPASRKGKRCLLTNDEMVGNSNIHQSLFRRVRQHLVWQEWRKNEDRPAELNEWGQA